MYKEENKKFRRFSSKDLEKNQSFKLVLIRVCKGLHMKFYRSYEIITENPFVSTTKIGQNISNILNCYFSN